MSKVYILGGAQTDFERNWTKEGKGMVALLKEAMADGLAGAGLTYDDVMELNKDNRVACFVGNFIAEKYTDQGHLGAFLTEVDKAFYGVPSARYEAACASSSVAIDAAATKIRADEYDVAIVVGWELMKTVESRVGGDYLGRAAYYDKEGRGIDLPFPKRLIGCGHPVGASGARMLLDLYKQVTYTAGDYQVAGAKNGMMLNIGGSATTNYVFIVGKE